MRTAASFHRQKKSDARYRERRWARRLARDVAVTGLHWKTIFRRRLEDALGSIAQARQHRQGSAGGLRAIADQASAQRLSRDSNNAISRTMRSVRAAGTLFCVTAIEMRLRRMRDEELASARVWSGQRHTKRASHVPPPIDLIANGVPRSSATVASRIATLRDEVGYDAMKALTIEVFPTCKRNDVVHGERRLA